MKRTHFLEPLLKGSPTGLSLLVDRDDRVVADSLEGAFDSRTRNKGLLGRASLADGVALVIAPCMAIHTFGMRFPIDVIYAARDGRVVRVRRNLPPTRISAALGAFAVIEMAAGSIDRAEVRKGDRLIVRRG